MDGFWTDRDQTLSVDSQEDCQTETVSQVLLVHQLTRPRQAGQLICQTEASPLQAASEDGETNVICQTEMDTVCVGDRLIPFFIGTWLHLALRSMGEIMARGNGTWVSIPTYNSFTQVLQCVTSTHQVLPLGSTYKPTKVYNSFPLLLSKRDSRYHKVHSFNCFVLTVLTAFMTTSISLSKTVLPMLLLLLLLTRSKKFGMCYYLREVELDYHVNLMEMELPVDYNPVVELYVYNLLTVAELTKVEDYYFQPHGGGFYRLQFHGDGPGYEEPQADVSRGGLIALLTQAPSLFCSDNKAASSAQRILFCKIDKSVAIMTQA